MLSRSVRLAATAAVRRALSLGLFSLQMACAAAIVFTAGCSLVPNQQRSVGVDQVERALLPIARVALDTGQLETAKRLYRRLLDVDAESYSARMGLGDVAFKDRRSEDAARWYLAAQVNATISEELYDALLWHGRASLEAGQLTAARSSFERLAAAEEQAPTTNIAWALNGIGLALLLEGDIEGAVGYMEQAVRMRPSEQMFADNLARAHGMLVELRPQEGVLSERPSRGEQLADDRVLDRDTSRPPAEIAPAPPEADALPPSAQATDVVEPASPQAPADPPLAQREETPAIGDRESTSDAAVGDDDAVATPPHETIDLQATPEAPAVEVDDAVASDAEEVPASPAVADADVPQPEGAGPVQAPVEADEPPAPAATAPFDAPDPVVTSALENESQSASADAWWPTTESGYVVRVEEGVFVQMGAFAERATAETVAYLLRDATHETVRVLGPQDGADALYRVRIGPVTSRAALADLADSLAAQGYGRPQTEDVDFPEPAIDDSGKAMDNLDGLLVQEGSTRFLQLGAFEVRMTANRLADRLRGLTGPNVAVAASAQGDSTMYRVRVGPIESDESLEEIAAVLAANGYQIDWPTEP